MVASAEYDSNLVMYELFNKISLPSAGLFTSASLRDALAQISARKDRSLVPVLVEIIRFVPSASSRQRMWTVLRDVTGQRDLSMETLAPRFGEFLRPAAEFSRIDLTEVVWEGVLPDGIPDLRDPRMLNAAEADYLNDDDRVFGVTINGDSRAYPLRIVNAHEMVNDTVGGEPISLMW